MARHDRFLPLKCYHEQNMTFFLFSFQSLKSKFVQEIRFSNWLAAVTEFWLFPCFGYPSTQNTSVLGISGRDTQNTDSWCDVCTKV